MPHEFYDIKITKNDGSETTLGEYRNKSLLVVNTASKCGFTSQYKGLEEMYQKYKDRDFEILAFPCNQFGGQEPGSDKDIAEFCELKYKTTFPLFAKIYVNGESTHPLFAYLKDKAPGILGSKSIKWNFTKFFVPKDLSEVKRFASQDTPEKIAKEIEGFL